MERCKVKVIELIDQALKCEQLVFCGCQIITGGKLWVCEGCRIKRALRIARVGIIRSAADIVLLKVQLIGVQEAIEDKIRACLEDGDLGEKGEKPNE